MGSHGPCGAAEPSHGVVRGRQGRFRYPKVTFELGTSGNGLAPGTRRLGSIGQAPIDAYNDTALADPLEPNLNSRTRARPSICRPNGTPRLPRVTGTPRRLPWLSFATATFSKTTFSPGSTTLTCPVFARSIAVSGSTSNRITITCT
jgi:hypothetical protein